MLNTNQPEVHPKVSVLMITYNHEKFVEQAVRGVMMQETDFDYELLIGEDCSTDRTREIVLRLKEEFPEKIRLILHEKNVGMILNFVAVYTACLGEYVAICEGDDYWTDEHKLQIQVDYMEAHPECRISFHAVTLIYENSTKSLELVVPESGTTGFTLYKLMRENFITTNSVMLRRIQSELPAWYFRFKTVGDLPLYVYSLLNGGEICLCSVEPLSTYRVHEDSVTNNKDTAYQIRRTLDLINDRHLLNRVTDGVYSESINYRISNYHNKLARLYYSQGEMRLVRYHLLNTFRYFHVELLSWRRLRKNFGLLIRSFIRI